MPEVVRHGETGFVVDGADAAVEAIAKLARADAERRFTIAAMTARYLDLYERLLA